MLRTAVLYEELPDLPTAKFLETWSWSTVSTPTFPEVCSWELSLVIVPTVNLK